MKLKIVCALLAAGLVLATETESPIPPPESLTPGQEPALPEPRMIQFPPPVVPAPQDTVPGRFMLHEGTDEDGKRETMRIDTATGRTWYRRRVEWEWMSAAGPAPFRCTYWETHDEKNNFSFDWHTFKPVMPKPKKPKK